VIGGAAMVGGIIDEAAFHGEHVPEARGKIHLH